MSATGTRNKGAAKAARAERRGQFVAGRSERAAAVWLPKSTMTRWAWAATVAATVEIEEAGGGRGV